uniref:Cytochrome b5 heme-binding domain-containing protein n=1 Tax=Setaria viridis TaxID=4556 RepID=A0A4U6VS91_SETVI|nr:hypothetical protein SEVIR_2G187000v2 [Setaria viridis]
MIHPDTVLVIFLLNPKRRQGNILRYGLLLFYTEFGLFSLRARSPSLQITSACTRCALISSSPGKGDAAHLAGSGKISRSYTKKEVSTHNTRKDCWIIIKDKVYDVTAYVEEHPGGDAILNNAGDDSTEGFFGPQHGTRVFDIIEDFCIGELRD